jgi:uncharacterized protein YqgC (DUF456 family)
MEMFWIALTVTVMLAGLVGTLVPVLPGIPLIYACYIFYGLISGWKAFGAVTLIIGGAITGFMILLDLYAGSIGAKRFGASRYGFWGAVAGSILGALAAGLPGLIVGPVLGAAAGELIAGRSFREAWLSGWGTFVGFVGGSLVKVVVASLMIGAFIWQVLSNG